VIGDQTTYVGRRPDCSWDDATLLASVRARATYLAEASRRVSGSLNLARTLRLALRTSVPELADWAQVMVRTGGRARYVAMCAAPEPLGVDVLEAELPAPAATGGDGQGRIMATGRSELLHVPADVRLPDGLLALVPDPRMREQVAALRPADVLGVALTARGTTFGTLALARRAGGGFSGDDVSLAEELAAQVALALDAALRYAERAAVAETLEASLRPPALPRLPGVQLAARYRPATAEADIGGDFYDVWGAADDWSLVLGDVAGKGVAAAVVTGQARHTVRGAAHVDRRPSRVLAALNGLLVDGGTDRLVTAVYGRIRPAPGGGFTATLGSAGHPPPLLVRPDGEVYPVRVAGLAAGLLPTVEYAETTVELAVGETLLCYTDGVTEAGRAGLRAGTRRLVRVAAEYARAGAEALVEAVEMDVVERSSGGRRDDLAVLAVRATG
jgi:serine phosphatase RsbU (regulator of sigma subunit)